MGRSSEADPPHSKTGFRTIEFVGRLVIGILMRFWALCTTAGLILLLLYWLYGSTIVLILLVVSALGLAYHSQDSLLYYPEQPGNARLYVESPTIIGLPYENIFWRTKDGVRINMYFIKQAPSVMSNVPTVIYLHGNAGNIGHRLLNAHALYSYTGVNILLVEYRGYGKSTGSPGENGLYYDAEAAFEFLLQRSDIDRTKIVIFGRSLGGAVAIHLASQLRYSKQALCLIVENTFTSLPRIARHLFDFRILQIIPDWCYKNQFPSVWRLPQVQLPTLFLSGLSDNLIPPRMMSELYECSGSAMKRLARFEQGTHNETWQCPGYYETMNRFFSEVYQFQNLKATKTAANYDVDIPFDDRGTLTYSL